MAAKKRRCKLGRTLKGTCRKKRLNPYTAYLRKKHPRETAAQMRKRRKKERAADVRACKFGRTKKGTCRKIRKRARRGWVVWHADDRGY